MFVFFLSVTLWGLSFLLSRLWFGFGWGILSWLVFGLLDYGLVGGWIVEGWRSEGGMMEGACGERGMSGGRYVKNAVDN